MTGDTDTTQAGVGDAGANTAGQQGSGATQAGAGEAHGGSGEAILPKSDHEKQQAARVFAEWWKDKGEKEDGNTAPFWLSLLRNVFGVAEPEKLISFERTVKLEGSATGYIDGFITLTSLSGTSRILIEQKNRNVYLGSKEKQSDGSFLTPFEQGKRYADWLGGERPRWVVTCNFREFWVYDLNKPPEKLGQDPEVVKLADFEKDWWRLAFLADAGKEVEKRQEAASRLTGELIGELHKKMKEKAQNPTSLATLKALNVFCVRLVFCFYAQSTGLFGSHTAFEDFIRGCNEKHIRGEIKRLFDWLDTPKEKRGENDIHDMGGFDYVDGGLFADKEVPIPYIDDEIQGMIIDCGKADWSEIDPVIFGSIFERALSGDDRHDWGMHYTSPRNIDKVLDPLFMDELAERLQAAKRTEGKNERVAALIAFQRYIAQLKFLDPACGSGNFLTRAYTRLRGLENQAIEAMKREEEAGTLVSASDCVQVSVAQFYGIEINDFAVSVAKTALWVAERQQLLDTERITGFKLKFLPIKTQASIFEGDALTLDWGTMKYKDNTAAVEPLKKAESKKGKLQPGLGFEQEEGAKEAVNEGAPDEEARLKAIIEEAQHKLEKLQQAKGDKEASGDQKGAEQAAGQQEGKKETVPQYRFDYIMGNPPFLGARVMSKEQKDELVATLGEGWQNAGNLDYVTGWYKKAAEFIKGTATRCAFVSTNSITQGEQVAALWKPLVAQGVHIDFAWRTFKWQNAQGEEKAAAKKNKASAKSQSAPKGKSKEGEVSEKHKESKVAAVHCVVVGFSCTPNDRPKVIYEVKGDTVTRKEASHINGYLLDEKDVFVESRQEQICGMPEIGIGNQPIDGGNYLFSEGEMNEFLKAEPAAKPYFHKWYGADEFINRRPRWCLYLGDLTHAQIKKLPKCKERSDAVREYRHNSTRKSTLKLADTPRKFQTTNMPKGEYIVIPETSSENRDYVPIGFMTPDILCSNAMKLMPNATLYHFGVLTSSAHMAWMKAVAGRLEMRYRYSKDIVYNNFVWPEATEEQRERITQTAQAILTARDAYPDETLADLYGKDMYEFPKLVRAHEANDRAVLAAYGWDADTEESDIVSRLLELYLKEAGG